MFFFRLIFSFPIQFTIQISKSSKIYQKVTLDAKSSFVQFQTEVWKLALKGFFFNMSLKMQKIISQYVIMVCGELITGSTLAKANAFPCSSRSTLYTKVQRPANVESGGLWMRCDSYMTVFNTRPRRTHSPKEEGVVTSTLSCQNYCDVIKTATVGQCVFFYMNYHTDRRYSFDITMLLL